jgi:NAD(P)-dependent dehydrogenase (short-subunit alcohol dehydrogenase family)
MTDPVFDFRDKVAFVTGDGTGIGGATALAFARAGASVVVAGHNPEHVEETAKVDGGQTA